MYKVRFHLQRGENYQHFQIRFRSEVVYVNPQTHFLVLTNCYLKNTPNLAKKICNGESRKPCAWVMSESYQAVLNQEQKMDIYSGAVEILFQPKLHPYWRWTKDDSNIDGQKFKTITTVGKRLFAHTMLNPE